MSFALHVHSEASGFQTRLSELALRARKKKIDAVILTDYFQQRVEWGWYPFHRWLKVGYEKPGISRFGCKKYFKAIDETNRRYPDVLLIPGAEVTPAYWWSGSLSKKNLTVHGLQKNMLVFGLNAGDLSKIPTVSNGRSKQNAYQGPSEEAYQEVIDYVREKGGWVVWSTPDENPATTFQKGPVHFETSPYTESLILTDSYTGICILPEGFVNTGRAGGIWDQTLKRYSEGKRKQAPWVFSELILHEILPSDIDLRFNVAWVEEKSEAGLLEAVSKGRFYALQRGRSAPLVLKDFYAADETGQKATLGGTLVSGRPAHLHAEIISNSTLNAEISVQLISGGRVIHTAAGKGLVSFNFNLERAGAYSPEKKNYYRLAVSAPEPELGILLSNPIFVSGEPGPGSEFKNPD